jgi:hypothetical protein
MHQSRRSAPLIAPTYKFLSIFIHEVLPEGLSNFADLATICFRLAHWISGTMNRLRANFVAPQLRQMFGQAL